MAEDFTNAGVMSKRTMRDFDELCLTPIKQFAAADVEALRKREEVSQAVFARHLGLSVNLISQWERGERSPVGPMRRWMRGQVATRRCGCIGCLLESFPS